MQYKAKIKKALAVLSPDLIAPEAPMQSALLKRAVALAKITGCELEIFHVCYDGGLLYQLFASDDELERQRMRLTDSAATRVAEVAARLRNEAIDVKDEVRWDNPRTDAILRKITQSSPDIVLKQAREHSFVLGITSNTDWELARRSPAHLWLVNNGVDDIDRIVAAVGNQPHDTNEITSAADYDIFRTAGLIGDIFKAEIHPVNAYQVPDTQSYVAASASMGAPVLTEEIPRVSRSKIFKKHNSNIRAFAQYFQIPTDNVHVCEGHPTEVIPNVAKSIDADMIVMGSTNISRFERLFSSVTVEPVIADAECDMLIVREHEPSSVPKAAESPHYGVPKYDLARAIIEPESTFETPQEVAGIADLSIPLRERILQAWEYDIKAEMREEDEGGPAGRVDTDVLDDIYSAKALLEMKKEKAGNDNKTLKRLSA